MSIIMHIIYKCYNYKLFEIHNYAFFSPFLSEGYPVEHQTVQVQASFDWSQWSSVWSGPG